GQAEAAGLVNEALPADRLQERVTEVAKKLLMKNRETLKATKDAMRRVREMTYDSAEDYLIRAQEALNWHDKTDGRHRGMKQFLDDKSYKPGLSAYVRREHLREQQVETGDRRIGEQAGDRERGLEAGQICRTVTEPDDHHRRGEEHAQGQRLEPQARRDQAEDRAPDRTADVRPGEHAGCRPGLEPHVDDDLGDPFDDEVEAGDVGEVHESDQYGRRQESRLEQVGDRAP